MSVTLFGKSFFADVIKLRVFQMRKLCWIIQVGLSPIKISFLQKGRGILEIDTEGKVMRQRLE